MMRGSLLCGALIPPDAAISTACIPSDEQLLKGRNGHYTSVAGNLTILLEIARSK